MSIGDQSEWILHIYEEGEPGYVMPYVFSDREKEIVSWVLTNMEYLKTCKWKKVKYADYFEKEEEE